MAMLEAQRGPLPVGPPGRLSEPFWSGAAEGELRFPRCSSCGRPDFPAAEHCRGCLSDTLQWEVSAGRGTVYSYTVVWRPVTPDFSTPYAPAVIELDEGYAMLSNLIGLDTDDLRVGMRVAVEFAALDGGLTLPYFRPATE
jgi:uncharacterized OB-fold protein